MNDRQPAYIELVGWRNATDHRMMRWPKWKDSRKPGTYMITLNVNGGAHLFGDLTGSTAAVYRWLKEHPSLWQAASSDALYYRHALLGTKAMPFVLDTVEAHQALGVETPKHKEPSSHRTHFPLEALSLPDAPRIALSPLGEKVKECWERMPQVVPEIEQVCLAIMPNHLHAIIVVRRNLSRSIGAVIRSFMGTTTHAMHQMMALGVETPTHKEPSPCGSVSSAGSSCGSVNGASSSCSSVNGASSSCGSVNGAGYSCGSVSTLSSTAKPSLWQPGYCIGVCQTERSLHTRIGYVLLNPFFAILESEHRDFMSRAIRLNIAGRTYSGYGNMLLLKEPERLQVFCHRRHPVTKQPYIETKDYQDEKATILDATANGAVIVTPGVSPGEKDIMWTVLQHGGSVINLQREAIPVSDKWHPDNDRRIYCSNGHLLVLSVHDLPNQTYQSHDGEAIPTNTKYARFHLLNLMAEELCMDGIEHECRIITQ